MKPFIIHKSQWHVVILSAFICFLFPLFINPKTAEGDNAAAHSYVGKPQKTVDNKKWSENQFDHASEISVNFAITGAPDEDLDANGVTSLTNAGAAYIYELDINDDWIKKQKIIASDAAENDLFGWTVALSGNTAIVSAPFEDHDTQGKFQATAAGSVYIFEQNGNSKWIETQKIVASDRTANDQFGSTLSIAENYLIIGAPQKINYLSAGRNNYNLGAAYIFEKDLTGRWQEVQKITIGGTKPVKNFGYEVSIFDQYAIISARSSQEFSGTDSVFIYKRSEKGIWHLKQTITDPKLAFLCLNKLY